MRGASRTVREGSVGLLFLAGFAVVGLILLWLNRFTASQESYKIITEFQDVAGMQTGSPVRYRGVKVGNITAIRPGANGVEVVLDIEQPGLVIPRDVKVEANQVGLISESVIDITPKGGDINVVSAGNPLRSNCNRDVILCNNSRLRGQIGISMDAVLRSTTELATVYSNQQFYENVNTALKQTAIAAGGVAELSRNLSTLSRNAQSQLNSFSSNTQSQLGNFSRTANSLGQTAERVGDSTARLSASADRTLSQFGATANEIRATSTQVSKLVNSLDGLVASNRSTLVSTLNNLAASSNQLRQTMTALSPTLNRLTQGEIIQNLENLTANAAEASQNLRNASQSLTDPKNAMLLQQTLDSARLTFENTQKITSDLDELTGDPKFRQNLRQLVNGLSGLVSSTQRIEQQVQIAQSLETIRLGKQPLSPDTFQLSSSKTITPEQQQRQQSLQRLTKILKQKQNGQSAFINDDRVDR